MKKLLQFSFAAFLCVNAASSLSSCGSKDGKSDEKKEVKNPGMELGIKHCKALFEASLEDKESEKIFKDFSNELNEATKSMKPEEKAKFEEEYHKGRVSCKK